MTFDKGDNGKDRARRAPATTEYDKEKAKEVQQIRDSDWARKQKGAK